MAISTEVRNIFENRSTHVYGGVAGCEGNVI